MRFTIKLWQRASLAALLAATIAPAIQGQQSNTARASLDRVLTKRTREFNNREMENELRRPVEEKDQQMALAQIKEDYVRLQVANHDMTQAASVKGALDLKFVAKSAAEIKKRAGRLRRHHISPNAHTIDPRRPDKLNPAPDARQGCPRAR